MAVYANDVYGLPNVGRFCESSLVDLGVGAGSSLASLLLMVHQESKRDDSLFSRGISSGAVEDLLLTAVLGIHVNGKNDRIIGNESQVLPYYVKRCIEYIETHANQDITMRALTEVAGCSLRTLQHNFTKHYGMGPRAYITRLKLLKVRNALRKTNVTQTTVGAVAAAWGFYSVSNFTQNYKRTFGELPSETLKT